MNIVIHTNALLLISDLQREAGDKFLHFAFSGNRLCANFGKGGCLMLENNGSPFLSRENPGSIKMPFYLPYHNKVIISTELQQAKFYNNDAVCGTIPVEVDGSKDYFFGTEQRMGHINYKFCTYREDCIIPVHEISYIFNVLKRYNYDYVEIHTDKSGLTIFQHNVFTICISSGYWNL